MYMEQGTFPGERELRHEKVVAGRGWGQGWREPCKPCNSRHSRTIKSLAWSLPRKCIGSLVVRVVRNETERYTYNRACAAAAAAAKSLQSCPTLCNPIDGSPPGSPIPGILQARLLEWVAIAFSEQDM